MPGTADKVIFGVKNVHYALLTDEGTPTYDTPVAIPGAVSLSLEASGESTPFYADNMQYYVTVSNSGYETELEVAIFPDSFLMDVLGYTQSTTDKVLTENSNTQPKPFALLFEEAGDQSGTKFVLYNCTATRPNAGGRRSPPICPPRTAARRCACWMWVPARAFWPSCWPGTAARRQAWTAACPCWTRRAPWPGRRAAA